MLRDEVITKLQEIRRLVDLTLATQAINEIDKLINTINHGSNQDSSLYL